MNEDPPLILPSPVERIQDFYSFDAYIKRDDKIHPVVSGNKYRKLKYILKDALCQKTSAIITYGGAFSNHIHATAAYCHHLGLPSLGLIRGELDPHNPTLQDVIHHNMVLHGIPRTEYKLKEQSLLIKNILDGYRDAYIIPEGGDHPLAYPGVAELVDELEQQDLRPDYIALAAGTGTTAIGLIKAIEIKKWPTGVLIFSSLSSHYLNDKIRQATNGSVPFHYFPDRFFGGYGKTNQLLWNTIEVFQGITGIPLEPIYTGKMIYQLQQLDHNKFFKTSDKVVLIHSGGLQGLRGYTYLQSKKVS